MKRFLYLSVLLPLVSLASPAQFLNHMLAKVKTYQAHFKQYAYHAGERILQPVASGEFFLAKPGKLRWQINQPAKQIIIASQGVLTIDDVSLQEVTRRKIDLAHTTPAALLSGSVNNLTQVFSVSAPNILGRTIMFTLTPKNKAESFQRLELYFVNSVLNKMVVTNNLGQTDRYQFSAIRVNHRLPVHVFTLAHSS